MSSSIFFLLLAYLRQQITLRPGGRRHTGARRPLAGRRTSQMIRPSCHSSPASATTCSTRVPCSRIPLTTEIGTLRQFNIPPLAPCLPSTGAGRCNFWFINFGELPQSSQHCEWSDVPTLSLHSSHPFLQPAGLLTCLQPDKQACVIPKLV